MLNTTREKTGGFKWEGGFLAKLTCDLKTKNVETITLSRANIFVISRTFFAENQCGSWNPISLVCHTCQDMLMGNSGLYGPYDMATQIYQTNMKCEKRNS